MDEFSFINEIKQSHYRQSTLRKGIGDDSAVIRASYQDFIITKDMFVENVHFAYHTMKPYHIGYKALAANISDLAAMGAKPAFYLVAVSIPDRWSINEIKSIFHGMESLAAQYQMDLIGGDTVSGTELVVSVTAIGFLDEGKARYRSTAQVGDIVFVTGTLGDSQAGLHILNNPDTYQDKSYFIKRHQMPSPRVEFALGLSNLPRITLNDISDGVVSEAYEIAEASDVSLVIQENAIPVHQSFTQFKPDLQYNWKYFGGEDFELIGTVAKEGWNLVQDVARAQEIRISKIGYVVPLDVKARVFLHVGDGSKIPLQKNGYNHLSR